MAIITLSEAKEHLRVDHSIEDTLIQLYIDTAEEYIENYLNAPSLPYNNSLRAAALLTVSDLYENRQGAGEKDVKENPAVMRLMQPFRQSIGI